MPKIPFPAAAAGLAEQPNLDTAIEETYNAMALLDIASFCADDLAEILDTPHNQIVGSLGRLLRLASGQVMTALTALEQMEKSA
ncbi:hypothetical protein EOS93_15650 [Rhizobium sp. RMa-01]|uniref:hypothetical protein n=1 Tax=unclassified Rhizobium TaxID=2613769 RepID=UPI0008D90378|nr:MULTISPECIES: hypothetical protein [unclassified Rhizobium]OHV26599.1 hypothetical protein BBJ66_00870 [Rhizobium sp. RSm-3]RVU10173.1 hypothetical protein EOS93_15650 [Rhizobium sp. RMa-01]